MTWRLLGAKPLSEPMLNYCQLNLLEQTSIKFESKHNNFIQQNECENVVCKMVVVKT